MWRIKIGVILPAAGSFADGANTMHNTVNFEGEIFLGTGRWIAIGLLLPRSLVLYIIIGNAVINKPLAD